MKIVATFKAAANANIEAAQAVISVPKKKENVVLPAFVASCLPPKEGENKLSPIQIQRALKWYESVIRIESLLAATDAKNFVIENGGMIGSYLLGQIRKILPEMNVVHHNFDPARWPLLEDSESNLAQGTIHVFAKQATMEVEDAVSISVFSEKEKIRLPQFVIHATDPKADIPHVERRKALSMFKYRVFLKELEGLQAKNVVLQFCSNLEGDLLCGILSTFKKVEYVNFPEEHFGKQAVQADKLIALKEKFAA